MGSWDLFVSLQSKENVDLKESKLRGKNVPFGVLGNVATSLFMNIKWVEMSWDFKWNSRGNVDGWSKGYKWD